MNVCHVWLYFYPSSQEKNKKLYELESVAVELDLKDRNLFPDYNASDGSTLIHQLLSLVNFMYMCESPCYMTDAGHMLYNIYCPSSVLWICIIVADTCYVAMLLPLSFR